MMTTGDKKNALKKLQNATKSIKYTTIDFKEISIGSPKEYLKLYHYLILDYNPAIAIDILNKFQIELQGKNDKSFIDSIYKIMRDMLNYKPPITKEQFFSIGYAEVKALMAYELINLIQQKFKLNTIPRSISMQQPTHVSLSSSSSTSTTLSSSSNAIHNAFTYKYNENHLNDIILKNKPVVSRTQSAHSANKTPLVHNHRILNTNLANNVKQSYTTDDINKNISVKHDENHKKNTILEMLTNSDEAQTTNNENETTTNSSSLFDITNQQQQQQLQYESLMTRIVNLEDLIRNNNQNMTLNHQDTTFIQIPKRDYENLISRLTILENEMIIIRQQNQQLLSSSLINNGNRINEIPAIVTMNNNESIPQRLSNVAKPQLRTSLNTKITPINHTKNNQNVELSVEDYDENFNNNEATMYETPFVSFMNNSNEAEIDNNDEDESTSLTPKAINASKKHQFESNEINDAFMKKGLLTQGILFDSMDNQNETISAANNSQLSNSTDLTPTIESTNASTDVLSRARSLVNRASAFNDQLTNKYK